MNIFFYEDKIKSRASLKECFEFACKDEELCYGKGNRKLVGLCD